MSARSAIAVAAPLAALVTLASAAPMAAPAVDGPRPAGPAAGGYVAPLDGRLVVLRPFRPPATRYGAGHLGVDLAAGPGTRVVAAADGTVTFAGALAGRGVVVVAHPDGVRTEYEPVRPAVRTGDRVRRGQLIATVLGRHRGCPVSCLHWGARRAADYLDPLGLLRRLGPVVLLPWGRDG